MKVWVEVFPVVPGRLRVFSSAENVVEYWKKSQFGDGPVPAAWGINKEKVVIDSTMKPITQMSCGFGSGAISGAIEVEVDEWFIDKAKENNNGNTKSNED